MKSDSARAAIDRSTRGCRSVDHAAHFLHRFILDLPDSLGGHAEFRGKIVQCGLILFTQPACFDNTAAAGIETRQRLVEALALKPRILLVLDYAAGLST